MSSSRFCILGSAGISRSIALALLKRQNVSVHVIGRNSKSLDELKVHGASCAVADARDPSSIEAAVKTFADGGALNGLVYGIGSIPLKPFKGTSAADMLEAYTINTVSAAMSLKAAAPALSQAQGGGSVVLFSSIAASVGFPNHVAIAAAKAGIESLVRSAGAELCPKIRVNAIAPSLTDTPLAARLLASEAGRKAMAEAHPLARYGTQDDITQAALFLLDPSLGSGWMSGQVLHIDGGRSTLRPKN